MDEKSEMAKIPYIVYEASMAKSERLIKRLVGALVFTNVFYVLIFLFIR